jgi:predicted DNA-binding transcriptional regulator AlpA
LKPLAVSIPEFCALVGCKRSLAFDLIRRREVVAVKLGRRTVVTVASIEQMLVRRSKGPKA